MREHPRLARAGAGQDEQRPVAVRDGGALLGIERVEDGIGQRFDGMCDRRLWIIRASPWTTAANDCGKGTFPREAAASDSSPFPGSLRLGERSPGAGTSGFFCDAPHDGPVVDDVLKSLIRLWTTSLAVGG